MQPMSPSLAATEARLKRLDAEAAALKDKPTDKPKSAAERRKERLEREKNAAEERAAEAKRTRLAREMSCHIRPVMTDAEISHCREVWR
jgi:hypothetical protein